MTRHRSRPLLAVVTLAGLLAVTHQPAKADARPVSATNLQQATRSFYAALNQVLAGDVAPMLRLWSHRDDVTYMSPFGQLLVGWKPIEASWRKQAGEHLGGRVEPADLHYFRSASLGVVVGFERGTVTISGKQTRVNIRATSTYRLEAGHWKMIGHHTDPIGS